MDQTTSQSTMCTKEKHYFFVKRINATTAITKITIPEGTRCECGLAIYRAEKPALNKKGSTNEIFRMV